MDANKSDLIALSRKVAYEGKIGRRRQEFCEAFIRTKQEYIRRINLGQKQKIQAAGETITCRGGCQYSSCCYEYVDASLREIEAIVYFLYQNESILKRFLKQYQVWEQKVYQDQSLMQALESQSRNQSEQGQASGMRRVYEQYYNRHIFCPFFNTDNNSCLIYDVRPFNCAGYVVTSPLSCCAPDYTGTVPVQRDLPVEDDFEKTRFYFNQIEKLIFVCMPKAVYELLTRSYFYLSTFPGLQGIESEAIQDKSVRKKLNPARSTP
jgi:hypothetical protein